MTTMDVRDANNTVVAVEKPLAPGRAAASGSRPVTLSTEDKAALDAIVPKGSLTDRSGTITVGGTAQNAMAENASRKYMLIQNPSDATESLFVNFGADASAASASIELEPGGAYSMPDSGFLSTQRVSVVAATTSHRFIAKEG